MWILDREDPAYPDGLRALGRRAPAHIHGQGTLPDLSRAVAIVGTRASDRAADAFTHQLAFDLARAGVCIVSGGARGVDRAAHEGALSAGGSTVCVLPNYFDAPYPRAHRALFDRIRELGALLTEAQGPCAPTASRCVARNRLIAALSGAVVVVQAPVRSGALTTARHARALGRDVFAVPASPWDPRGEGCVGLLRGATRICTGAGDVLSLAAADTPAGPSAPPGMEQKKIDFGDLDEDQGAVARALHRGPAGAELLCEELALPPARVQRAVLTLLLAGAIEEISGGRYRSTGR